MKWLPIMRISLTSSNLYIYYAKIIFSPITLNHHSLLKVPDELFPVSVLLFLFTFLFFIIFSVETMI